MENVIRMKTNKIKITRTTETKQRKTKLKLTKINW